MTLGRLDIDIPESWEDRSMYTFIAPRAKADKGLVPADDGFRTSMCVTPGPAGVARDLADIVADAKEHARMSFGVVQVSEESGPAIAGSDSVRIGYRIIEPGGALPLAQFQYLTVVDETEWTFTFTTAAVNAKAVRREMEEMIRTVRIGRTA